MTRLAVVAQAASTPGVVELVGSVQEVEDVAVRSSQTPELINIRLWVVYAPTFQVPALYFSAHRSSES